MINLIQHGVRSSDLLARRFSALLGHFDAAALDNLGLDETRLISELGSETFESSFRRREVQVLAGGVVGEVRLLPDGRRQILALRFPGDALIPSEGERLVALTRVRVAEGARLMSRLAEGSEVYQPLRRAWMAALRTDQAILRDQVVRLGRMSAFERMAHMLLETHERLAQVGLATANSFHLPVTQEVVSDLIGVSVVHLNRTLQSLRREGLVSSRNGEVTLLDRERLVAVAAYVSRFPAPWRPDPPERARPAAPGTLALAS